MYSHPMLQSELADVLTFIDGNFKQVGRKPHFRDAAFTYKVSPFHPTNLNDLGGEYKYRSESERKRYSKVPTILRLELQRQNPQPGTDDGAELENDSVRRPILSAEADSESGHDSTRGPNAVPPNTGEPAQSHEETYSMASLVVRTNMCERHHEELLTSI